MKTHELEQFLDELTELTRRFGIGITGQPVLFCLEGEDFNLVYTSDEDSNLSY